MRSCQFQNYVLSYVQVLRHVGIIHSGVQGTTGFQQNRLLCPVEALNIVRPLTCTGKILGLSSFYCKFHTKHSSKIAFEIERRENM